MGGRGPRGWQAHGETGVQRSRDGSGMIIGPTKNKKSRTIRLGIVAIEALKAHRERQAAEVASANGHWKNPDLVFASTIGTPSILQTS
jgi:integrase